MKTLTTVGRIVKDSIYEGAVMTDDKGQAISSTKEKFVSGALGSGTLTLLKAARALDHQTPLNIIAETVADKNDAEALAEFGKYNIGYDHSLINPDSDALISAAEWVHSDTKKHRHHMDAPNPTLHLMEAMEKVALPDEGAVVLCAEYVTDNLDDFMPLISKAAAKPDLRIWSAPNTRAKAPELKQQYRNNLAEQLYWSELAIFAHSDLAEVFDENKGLEGNLAQFKEAFSDYTNAVIVVTNGGEEPVLLDMETGERTYGPKPEPLGESRTTVGAGDTFNGALFIQLMNKLNTDEPISTTLVSECIGEAHRVAASHILGVKPPSKPATTSASEVIKSPTL